MADSQYKIVEAWQSPKEKQYNIVHVLVKNTETDRAIGMDDVSYHMNDGKAFYIDGYSGKIEAVVNDEQLLKLLATLTPKFKKSEG